MLSRIITVLIVAGALYWYWSGPYQDRVNPSYAASVAENDEAMRKCVRAAVYRSGTTGEGPDGEEAERLCAQQHNVYEEDGHWHRYDMSRPH